MHSSDKSIQIPAVKLSMKRVKRWPRSYMQISSRRQPRITRISVSRTETIALAKLFPECRHSSSLVAADVFDLLMVEMRKSFNPPPEKKKQGWFASWFGGA